MTVITDGDMNGSGIEGICKSFKITGLKIKRYIIHKQDFSLLKDYEADTYYPGQIPVLVKTNRKARAVVIKRAAPASRLSHHPLRWALAHFF
jgi:hypothetical protein